MGDNELYGAEPMGTEGIEPLPEEVPTGEMPVEEEVSPVLNMMQHSLEELPALKNYSVGDEMIFRVSNISNDGKLYDLELIEGEMAAPPAAAGAAGAMPAGGAGKEQVIQSLL